MGGLDPPLQPRMLERVMQKMTQAKEARVRVDEEEGHLIAIDKVEVEAE